MINKLKQIQHWIIFFMIVLFLSALTAIPLERELAFLSLCFFPTNMIGAWIEKVYPAIFYNNRQYSFIAYGYDRPAFAHFVLAILFIGPLKNPVRNKWVIGFGMITCLLIILFAFFAGHFRGIPIDCAFGVIGIIPISICPGKIIQIEKIINKNLSI